MQRVINLVPFSAIFVVAITLLFSGFYIGWFNYLAHDDFWRSIDDGQSLIGNFKWWYFSHNGRFANAIIASHHWLYDLKIYRFLHIVVIIYWLLALYFFYSRYLTFFIKNNFFGGLALTAITFIAVTSGAPELSEWWFWYASSSVYMVGSGFFFMGIGFLLAGIGANQTKHFLMGAMFLFFACGSHELLSMVSVCTAIIMCLLIRNAKLFFPVFSSVLGVSFLIFSPGTSSRLLKVSGKSLSEQINYTFFHYIDGVFNTLKEGLIYWTSNNLWWLTFATIVSLFFFFPPLKNRERLYKGLTISVIVSISILLCSALLPVLLNWKVNINDPTRLTNLVYMFFIVMMVILAIYIAIVFREYFFNNRVAFNAIKIASLLAPAFLFVEVMSQKNILTIFDDIRLNKPSRQLESINHWRESIKNNRSSPIIFLSGLIPSHTLVVNRYKPTRDQHNYFNRMWARHLGAHSNQKIIKNNFDYELSKFITAEIKSASKHHALFTYRDSFRHYLLINLYRPKITNNSFCVELFSDETYNVKINDESFKSLNFVWDNNKLCTDFVSNKVFCEIIDPNMICRIPLPARFNGKLKTEWGNITKLHYVP